MSDRAVRMVRGALDRWASLQGRSYVVIPQGSYHNNTNVRLSSDVDLCVAFTDVELNDFTYAPGWSSQSLGLKDSPYRFDLDREAVGEALRHAFGFTGVTPGNKAFQVHSNIGTRVDADVVPAYRFQGHSTATGGQLSATTGVVFWARNSGIRTVNFPEQHTERGTQKNVTTGRRFKRAVRVFKALRYQLLEENHPAADGVSSFELECALFNMPDELFTQPTWRATIFSLLNRIGDGLRDGSAEQKWVEVSHCKWMFQASYGQPAHWTTKGLTEFVRVAIARLV